MKRSKSRSSSRSTTWGPYAVEMEQSVVVCTNQSATVYDGLTDKQKEVSWVELKNMVFHCLEKKGECCA
jgi:hypothetical protein